MAVSWKEAIKSKLNKTKKDKLVRKSLSLSFFIILKSTLLVNSLL